MLCKKEEKSWEEKKKVEKGHMEYNSQNKEETELKVDPEETSQTISQQLEWEEGMYRNRNCIIYLKWINVLKCIYIFFNLFILCFSRGYNGSRSINLRYTWKLRWESPSRNGKTLGSCLEKKKKTSTNA